MKISDAFPSTYLKASDLQGGAPTVTIERTEMEMLGDDRKMVVYFQGKQKGLVTNKTNANTIAALYGDETEDWIGQRITLVEAMVDFQGRSVPAIRIRAPKANGTPRQSSADMGRREPPPERLPDDGEIPW